MGVYDRSRISLSTGAAVFRSVAHDRGRTTSGDPPTTRLSPSSMLFALVFLLGIANFAAHKAVLESGHPILERMAWLRPGRFGPPSLIVEFAVLLATLLFLAEGYGGIGWVYAIYSLCNIGSAWALLTGRM